MVFNLTMTDRRGFALPAPSEGVARISTAMPFYLTGFTLRQPRFPSCKCPFLSFFIFLSRSMTAQPFLYRAIIFLLAGRDSRILRYKGRSRCQSVKVRHAVFVTARWRFRSIFPSKTLPYLPCATFTGTVVIFKSPTPKRKERDKNQ